MFDAFSSGRHIDKPYNIYSNTLYIVLFRIHASLRSTIATMFPHLNVFHPLLSPDIIAIKIYELLKEEYTTILRNVN